MKRFICLMVLTLFSVSSAFAEGKDLEWQLTHPGQKVPYKLHPNAKYLVKPVLLQRNQIKHAQKKIAEFQAELLMLNLESLIPGSNLQQKISKVEQRISSLQSKIQGITQQLAFIYKYDPKSYFYKHRRYAEHLLVKDQIARENKHLTEIQQKIAEDQKNGVGGEKLAGLQQEAPTLQSKIQQNQTQAQSLRGRVAGQAIPNLPMNNAAAVRPAAQVAVNEDVDMVSSLQDLAQTQVSLASTNQHLQSAQALADHKKTLQAFANAVDVLHERLKKDLADLGNGNEPLAEKLGKSFGQLEKTNAQITLAIAQVDKAKNAAVSRPLPQGAPVYSIPKTLAAHSQLAHIRAQSANLMLSNAQANHAVVFGQPGQSNVSLDQLRQNLSDVENMMDQEKATTEEILHVQDKTHNHDPRLWEEHNHIMENLTQSHDLITQDIGHLEATPR